MTRSRQRMSSAGRLFAFLIALFPRDFRDAYGEEMRQVFAEQRSAASGPAAVIQLWWRTTIGMVTAAWRERRPPVAAARRRASFFQPNDLRYAFRRLAAAPAFSATAIATLALCLGANLTIFAVVDSVLLRPLPFPDAGRLALVFNTYPKAGVIDDGASITNYYERRGRIAAFASLALYRDDGVIVGDTGHTEREFVMRVTPDFFATLGVTPMLGRSFRDDETTPGADRVVILTEPYWRQQFAGDPAAVGRTLRINGSPFTIAGVLPSGFTFLSSRARIILPLVSRSDDRSPARRHSGSSSHMIARLAPDVTLADAQAQLDAHNAAVEADNPEGPAMAAAGFRSLIVPLHASHVAAVRSILLLLQAGAAVLMLIGLVNVTNLLLIRAGRRARELAVRRAIGATTADIVSAVMAETLLLAAAGAAGGLLIAQSGIGLLSRFASRLPLGTHVVLNGRSVAAAFAAAIGAAVVLGAGLAWHHLRGQAGDTLRSETRGGTTGRQAQRVRQVFLVAQIALSFVLVSGSTLLALSLRAVVNVSPGFRSDQVLSGQISLPWSRYGSEPLRLSFVDRLMTALDRTPGVVAAGVSTNVPLSGNTIKSVATVAGHPAPPGESPKGVYSYGIAGNYFGAMGIPLIAGRYLSQDDIRPGARVCVVDEDFARRYWPAGGAVGQRLFAGPREEGPDDAFTIVGVVGAVKQAALSDADRTGAIYYPYADRFDSAVFVVSRVTLPEEAMQPVMRQIVRSLDPELPVNNLRTMETRISDSLAARRSPAVFAGVFSMVALLLAAVGTYGVLSYAVAGRRREIGIRMALGARPEQVRIQFASMALRVLGAGLVIGTAGAWIAGRAMRGLLFGVAPTSLSGLGLSIVILSAACLGACLLPVYRAARVSPVEALARE